MNARFWILALAALPLAAQVTVTQSTDHIDVAIDGKLFTTLYWTGPTKPYLHPLRSASGVIVTRHYPMEVVEGESHDHPHHRGLWFAHGDVNGYDFWSENAKGKQGKIRLKKITGIHSGAKEGRISAIFEWVDPEGHILLTENRTMVFRGTSDLRTIDFTEDLKAVATVKFGDTKEGTFALRLAEPLKEDKGGTGKMVNANGAQTEANVWGKRSPWVDYAGTIDGQKIGIAIFDHPKNPKHPTYWHARAYGLFAANPFGEHDFYRDKTKDGSLTVEAGHSIQFRYRVVIHPGDAQSAHIASLYSEYSKE